MAAPQGVIRRPRKRRLPLIYYVTFGTMLLSTYLPMEIFGRNLSGWSWVLIAVISAYRISLHFRRMKKMVLIWIPWTLFVGIYGFSGYDYAWQSTAQILCPVIAAAALTTYRLDPGDLDSLEVLIRRVFWLYYAGFLFIVVPFSLSNIDNSGFASGAITALFFQSYFLGQYLLRSRRRTYLIYYLCSVAIPLISANRGPLAASVLFAALAFMPISLRRRILIVSVAVLIGFVAFHSEKIQHKMFYSGHGSFSDLRLNNPNLQTSGRLPMWNSLESGISDKPWLGHGGNADRTWLLNRGFRNYLPHNDWLRIRFNYGWCGVILFVGTMIVQTYQVLRKVRTPYRGIRRAYDLRGKATADDRHLRAIVASGISCFIPFVSIMYTDNVLIYCQFFTVPMMLLIATAYAYSGRRQPTGTMAWLSVPMLERRRIRA